MYKDCKKLMDLKKNENFAKKRNMDVNIFIGIVILAF